MNSRMNDETQCMHQIDCILWIFPHIHIHFTHTHIVLLSVWSRTLSRKHQNQNEVENKKNLTSKNNHDYFIISDHRKNSLKISANVKHNFRGSFHWIGLLKKFNNSKLRGKLGNSLIYLLFGISGYIYKYL